jgi:hypothetical protein
VEVEELIFAFKSPKVNQNASIERKYQKYLTIYPKHHKLGSNLAADC